MKYKILNIVGARPNFMKIAPLQREMDKYKKLIEYKLIHTGQHYDKNMSDVFFKELRIKNPDYYLGVGSGPHGGQTGKIMIKFEKILLKENPDLIIVVGDVNSTLACSITASKLGVKVAHVEAGCRSFDRKMPEEINRILTDAVSDYLFVFDKICCDNLIKEGISQKKIFLVGDIMIDTLKFASGQKRMTHTLRKLKLRPKEYCILTAHRPSNVDNKESLKKLLNISYKIQRKIKIIFPIHPRTKKMITKNKDSLNLTKEMDNLIIIDPLSYFEFIDLLSAAKFLMTDSGSLQEESSFLNIPCLTLRDTTERPFTVTSGTNVLTHLSEKKILYNFNLITQGRFKKSKKLKFRDGKVSERIVGTLLDKRTK